MIRCKFQLYSITEFAHAMGKELIFQASYDPSIPEDQAFSKATPSGRLMMYVNNQAALDQLKKGQYYYFDISPAG